MQTTSASPTLAGFRPSAAVLELGEPEWVFSAGRGSNVFYIMAGGTGLALFLIAVFVVVAFMSAGHEQVAHDPMRVGIAMLGSASALMIGLLLLWVGLNPPGPAVGAIFAPALAYNTGGGWTIIPWAAISHYEDLTLLSPPVIFLQDGRKVELANLKLFPQAVRMEIERKIHAARPQPKLRAAAQQTEPPAETASDLPKLRPASYTPSFTPPVTAAEPVHFSGSAPRNEAERAQQAARRKLSIEEEAIAAEQQVPDPRAGTWADPNLASIGSGLLMLAGAIYINWSIGQAEETGGTFRAHAFIVLAYTVGGRAGAVAAAAIPALCMIAFGTYRIMNAPGRRKSRRR